MWLKWFPWRFILCRAAKKSGFLDPLTLFSRLQKFSQPSEVAAPVELLRSGAVMHARGLVNSQAIQHNLDWVWPFWVERQFDPHDIAFIPRAFSITHINLTHRNWTAVGLPGMSQYPIVDPRGLVTPFFDGWSIDAWIIPEHGEPLIPSRLSEVKQELIFERNLEITTISVLDRMKLEECVYVQDYDGELVCHIQLKGYSHIKGRLVISLRPYNPEGISFIHDIELLPEKDGWKVNKEKKIYFDTSADFHIFSSYHDGDVYSKINQVQPRGLNLVVCDVGMGTGAVVFELSPSKLREINIRVPLLKKLSKSVSWVSSLTEVARLKVPDKKFQFLYDAAVRTLILHSPEEVYPGPYTYRRFWFRDAAFILNAMLCVGLKNQVKKCIDQFPSRQTPLGYFLSQEGEWDSNGEALWAIRRYCELTQSVPDKAWHHAIHSGGLWICRKRLSDKINAPHAGLLPAGFSAEHLGPNNYYYWDDFWGVAGLESAAFLAKEIGRYSEAKRFQKEAKAFRNAIEKSLKNIEAQIGSKALPSSPYRRLDAGSIGSLAAGYPLQLWAADDQRLKETVEFLMNNCLVQGCFFQEMTHSGMNPYLTLHMAQVLLRAGDKRFFDLMQAVAHLASPTGQWPEAIHPQTLGGCMGDGQHVWAAAEWVMMIKNCFVHEEEDKLILCSGIPEQWMQKGEDMSLGAILTKFGKISIFMHPKKENKVSWKGEWFDGEPEIKISTGC